MNILTLTIYVIFLLTGTTGLKTKNVTKLHEKLELLSRKKRYLTFPEGSNFVINMSAVKALMIVQPRGFLSLLEVDVPFPLPSDTRWLKTLKNSHYNMHRRDVLTRWEETLNGNGIDGTACVKRMICDFQTKLLPRGVSMISDMLSCILSSNEADLDSRYHNFCTDNHGCSLPLVDFIMSSLIETSDSRSNWSM